MGSFFFHPDSAVTRQVANLPHWRQEHVVYFITFRLADALPREKRDAWMRRRETWLRHHPEPHDEPTRTEYHRLFTAAFHRWLDAGHGSCVLGQPALLAMMAQTLGHFAGKRYGLGRFVVMPNHVHALVAPWPGHSLSGILHSWKSFSANRIRGHLGTSGPLRQKETYDHIVRSASQLMKLERYIEENPSHLRPGTFALGGQSAGGPGRPPTPADIEAVFGSPKK